MGMNGIMIRVFLGLFLFNIVVVLNVNILYIGNYRKIYSYMFETLSVDF